MSFTCNHNEMRAVPAGHASARGPVSSAFAGQNGLKPWAGQITQCAFDAKIDRVGRHTRRGTWRGRV